MKTIKTWTWGAAAALALDIITACEPAVEAAFDDDAPISFRDSDGEWGPGKLNTHFLGEDETFPLNAVPLQDNPNATIRLHAVWTDKCSSVPNTWYYTSDLDGELGITLTEGGDLNPAVFKRLGNPSVQCTIAGDLWVGTVWGFIHNGENVYMRIGGRTTDAEGRRLWRVERWVGGPPFEAKSYKASCLKDQDEDNIYDYAAYFLKDVDVAGNGDFFPSPATMYVACISGAVGKSKNWGFGMPDVDEATHELATRFVRADYCGDGTPFTFEGNPVQVDDVDGNISEFDDIDSPDEAAWSLELGRATCVTVPRHEELRPIWLDLTCPGKFPEDPAFTLTTCTQDDRDAADFLTKIAH